MLSARYLQIIIAALHSNPRCGKSGTNFDGYPNTTHSHANTYTDPYFNIHTNTDADTDAHTNTDADTDAHTGLPGCPSLIS